MILLLEQFLIRMQMQARTQQFAIQDTAILNGNILGSSFTWSPKQSVAIQTVL